MEGLRKNLSFLSGLEGVGNEIWQYAGIKLHSELEILYRHDWYMSKKCEKLDFFKNEILTYKVVCQKIPNISLYC